MDLYEYGLFFVRPHLNTVSSSVAPNTRRTWVQKRVTEMVRGTDQLSWEKQAEAVEIVQPGEDWGDFRAAFKYLKGTFKNGGEGLLQGHAVTGQGAMALNLKRAGLD